MHSATRYWPAIPTSPISCGSSANTTRTNFFRANGTVTTWRCLRIYCDAVSVCPDAPREVPLPEKRTGQANANEMNNIQHMPLTQGFGPFVPITHNLMYLQLIS